VRGRISKGKKEILLGGEASLPGKRTSRENFLSDQGREREGKALLIVYWKDRIFSLWDSNTKKEMIGE